MSLKFLIIVHLVYMHSLLNSLEQLLCWSGEDADIFLFYAERTQRLFLKDILGDDDTNTALLSQVRR